MLFLTPLFPGFLLFFFDLFHLIDRFHEMFFNRGGEIQFPVFLVFRFCFEPGCLCRHGTGMGEDIAVADLKELIQLGDPVRHLHRLSVDGLEFGKFQIQVDDPVELIEFLRRQVIFGDGDVRFAW